jgi:hypothetical protein
MHRYWEEIADRSEPALKLKGQARADWTAWRAQALPS